MYLFSGHPVFIQLIITEHYYLILRPGKNHYHHSQMVYSGAYHKPIFPGFCGSPSKEEGHCSQVVLYYIACFINFSRKSLALQGLGMTSPPSCPIPKSPAATAAPGIRSPQTCTLAPCPPIPFVQQRKESRTWQKFAQCLADLAVILGEWSLSSSSCTPCPPPCS